MTLRRSWIEMCLTSASVPSGQTIRGPPIRRTTLALSRPAGDSGIRRFRFCTKPWATDCRAPPSWDLRKIPILSRCMEIPALTRSSRWRRTAPPEHKNEYGNEYGDSRDVPSRLTARDKKHKKTFRLSPSFFHAPASRFPGHPGWGCAPKANADRPSCKAKARHQLSNAGLPRANSRYTTGFMLATTVLDTNWMGRARSIAAVLLESDGHRAVIDPGPASTLSTLRGLLEARGIGVSDLNAILLTHIHLDHAGATGALIRENPNIEVYVHKAGMLHMADPSKLLASAERLWPGELQHLFGETLPVPFG